MNSLKTGVIIAFGLTVLYGVYLVINKPEPSPEAQAAADATPELSIDESMEEETASDPAKPSEDEAPLETDSPAAEVAQRKPIAGSARGDEEATTEPTPSKEDAATEPSSDAASSDGEMTEAESDEPRVAPWRKQPESTPAAEHALETEAKPESKAKPEDELPIKAVVKPEAPTEKPAPSNATEAEAETPESEESSEVKIAPRKTESLSQADFDAAWTKMESEIEKGKLKEALTTISPFYHADNLSEDDSKQLFEVLDLLAWRVIFSKEHFLAKPHIVAAGESLDEIAQRYRVPAEVISKINGIKSSKLLMAGAELKVIPGPFRAEVAPERGELTLFLGDLYATRYAVEAGTEPPPEPGEYTVIQRSLGAVYRTKENRDIAAQNPRNPYGGVFLDLGDGQCLHGSPEQEEGEELGQGCLRLRGKDAKEVYWLLSKGSKVSVLR